MMEYWNDVEDKKTKILLYPLFHYSNIPLFQLRSEAELSSVSYQTCFYFPFQLGFLFSKNAESPSLASSANRLVTMTHLA